MQVCPIFPKLRKLTTGNLPAGLGESPPNWGTTSQLNPRFICDENDFPGGPISSNKRVHFLGVGPPIRWLGQPRLAAQSPARGAPIGLVVLSLVVIRIVLL